MAKTFHKMGMVGTLQEVYSENRRSKTVKIKRVLMLVSSNGKILFTEEFRSNATRKAEKTLVSQGWKVTL